MFATSDGFTQAVAAPDCAVTDEQRAIAWGLLYQEGEIRCPVDGAPLASVEWTANEPTLYHHVDGDTCDSTEVDRG